MARHFLFNSLLAACGVIAVLGLHHPALADGKSRMLDAPLLPKYKQECAACHIAFPPRMLPSASWQRVMSNLPHHYGTDASLDSATVAELSTWLSTHAGTAQRPSAQPLEDRITRSDWFVREHRELPAATWKRPAIRSAANCTVCHAQADKGDFDERNIRIPR
jgi:hypothetical protein